MLALVLFLLVVGYLLWVGVSVVLLLTFRCGVCAPRALKWFRFWSLVLCVDPEFVDW